VAPALRPLGVVDLGVSELLLLGSRGFLHLPIDWIQVEDNAAFVCSQVTDVERLLHETLALVGRNILRSIQVSLKKERKVCLCTSGFLRVHLLPPVLVSITPVME
jgi:hypothetical protein